ncbi:RNA polymerase sigma-54 factor [Planctomycetes bacterium Poly30]|uniref:RNA polymerase sigma-54 factor n=1 Tax=Saltatorellus ferox TaxID=2528018 RepID=A0A518EWA6_9BACT|nr:RNA polymerase sigma-54 factor [Planctomycetes bacterium Poly30]
MAKLGLGTQMRQGMQQRQDMVLAPRMLQSIEILTLPRTDLDAWLSEEAERNEALLVEGSEGDRGGPSSSDEPGRSSASRNQATEDHYALLQAQPERAQSLVDAVEEQVRARDLPADLARWVEFLCGCLDDSGLLLIEDDEIMGLAEQAELPMAGASAGHRLMADAIATLQQLEPAGIGARSSVEALLLQLDPKDPDYALLCTLLEDFLVELSRNKRPAVADKLGLGLLELDRLLGVLSMLDMRPGSQLAGSMAPVLHPDILVHDDGDTFTVELAHGALPAVSIDPVAEELLSSGQLEPGARSYLRGKVEKARWVTEAVEMRGTTLLRVAEATLRHQAAFLTDGPTALRPLSMAAVAEELGLATSTVSRSVAGKSAQTPWGILPLRSFFQSAPGEAKEGSAGAAPVCGTAAVRERVRQLVEAEDASDPLSDEALVQALKAAGITVARRTVAKYRTELGIESSYRRKRHV